MRARVVATLLAVSAFSRAGAAAAADTAKHSALPKEQRPLLMVMNEVVDGLLPKILAEPSPTTQRVTVRNGLLGLGPFEPRGGSDGGLKTPPRNLFPRAGLGNSLNVDPITGSNSQTHNP
ncbi:MAG TPA: hypothetical protein VN375_21455 [Vicinamibacteria bacterium]|nr:hypothetical protein [Vicinamibacteria bacterium]